VVLLELLGVPGKAVVACVVRSSSGTVVDHAYAASGGGPQSPGQMPGRLLRTTLWKSAPVELVVRPGYQSGCSWTP